MWEREITPFAEGASEIMAFEGLRRAARVAVKGFALERDRFSGGPSNPSLGRRHGAHGLAARART